MTITTPKNSKFDTNKPAKSSVITVLNGNGYPIPDELRLTGKYTVIEGMEENFAMIEVEHSFGVDEVSEDFLWQD